MSNAMTTPEEDWSSSSEENQSSQTTRKRHVHRVRQPLPKLTQKQLENAERRRKEKNAKTSFGARVRQKLKDDKQRSLQQKKQSQSARIRQQMISQSQQEKREQRRIAKIAMRSQSPFQKYQLALFLNIIAIAFAGVLYLRPDWFFERKKQGTSHQWPPHHLAVLYPRNVSPRKEVPLFFQTYAIATDSNRPTREAMQKLMGTRQLLKPFKIFLTGWERERMLEHYPLDDYCGAGFEKAYNQSMDNESIRHAEDLLHWCLLHTYQNDGFVQWNTTMERSPISLSRNAHYTDEDTLKGITVKLVGHDRIHPSLLWLPKKRERKLRDDNPTKTVSHFDMNSQLPSKMLSWLIDTAPSINVGEYPVAVEEHMYQLVMAEEEHWMILDAVCEHYGEDEDPTTRQELQAQFEDRGIMGRDCLSGQACCVTYLPKRETSSRAKRRRQMKGENSNSSDSED